MPACLFWSAILISLKPDSFSILQNYQKNISILIIIFLGSGFIISSISALIMNFIHFLKKSLHSKPEDELEVWRKLSTNKDFLINKIDRRWNYCVINLTSSVSIILFLIIKLYFSLYMREECFLNIFYSCLFVIFILLTYTTYKKDDYFSKNIKEVFLSKNTSESKR